MAQISYLKRRGATYYARLPVPLELHTIAGTTEKSRSLRTKDPKEAKKRLPPVISAWQREFQELQQRREIEPADLAHAVWDHYTDELELDGAARLALPTQADIDAVTQELFAKAGRGEFAASDVASVTAATLDVKVMQGSARFDQDARKAQAATMRKHLATGETALIEWAADDFIARKRLLIEKDGPQYRDLCLRLQRAHLEFLNRTFERDHGDYGGAPKDPIVAPPLPGQKQTAAPGESVMELFEQYARENPKGVKPDTLNQSRYTVASFVETVGKTFPASRIDKKAVREWKALLLHE